jgi:hypothetical protein
LNGCGEELSRKNMIEVRAYSKEEVATHKIEVIRV